MTDKRYILVPGRMPSRHDDDIHRIGVGQLAALYGVKIHECLVDAGTERCRGLPDLPRLTPRHNGDYRLPT